MKIIIAEPGINPLEMPELIKRKRNPLKLAFAILLLVAMCATPTFFVVKAATTPKTTPTPAVTATHTPEWVEVEIEPTGTARPSSTPFSTFTPTVITPTVTATPSATLSISATPAPNQPTQIVTVIVMQTVIVNRGGGGGSVEVTRVVEREVTRVVEVTPLPSATPTATQGPSATPKPSPTPWDCIKNTCYYQIFGFVSFHKIP